MIIFRFLSAFIIVILVILSLPIILISFFFGKSLFIGIVENCSNIYLASEALRKKYNKINTYAILEKFNYDKKYTYQLDIEIIKSHILRFFVLDIYSFYVFILKYLKVKILFFIGIKPFYH